MDKTKIMIVEDEAIVAEDLSRQLTNLGYDVVATALIALRERIENMK